jgi:Hedgehog amino-terminal signalling domain
VPVHILPPVQAQSMFLAGVRHTHRAPGGEVPRECDCHPSGSAAGRGIPRRADTGEEVMELPQGLQLKSDAVVVEGIVPAFWNFIQHLGLVHQLVFGEPLVITSGRDSTHEAGSLHYAGRAVDVRTSDTDTAGQLLLLHLVQYAAPENKVCVLDERGLPGEAHLHIEYHGA